MGVATTLKNEVLDLGILVMLVVVLSVVILKFKNVSGVTSGLNTTIDTFVTAFSEPKNWVIIIIIGLIAIGLIKLFMKIGKE